MREPANTTSRTAFDALLGALADGFAREGRQGGAAAAEALRKASAAAWRARPAQAAGRSDPGALLDRVATQAGALEAARLASDARALLDWEPWTGEGLAEAASEGLHTTELVGPDGHVAADGVRVGLLASDAWIDYPASSHSGEETYWALSGTAEWMVGEPVYALRPPGALIHHPAWEIHGRRTLAEPFLGAWRWSGDLDLGSFRVRESAQ